MVFGFNRQDPLSETDLESLVLPKVDDGDILCLTLPHPPPPDQRDHIGAAFSRIYERLGRKPPFVLILQKGEDLQVMTDDRLAALGLMRVPART